MFVTDKLHVIENIFFATYISIKFLSSTCNMLVYVVICMFLCIINKQNMLSLEKNTAIGNCGCLTLK